MTERDPAGGADTPDALPTRPPDSWAPQPAVERIGANGGASATVPTGSTAAADGYAPDTNLDAPSVLGERPLSLRPRDGATEPVATVVDRGERVYIDAWDAAERELAPPRPAGQTRRSNLLLLREIVETATLAVVIFLAVRAVVQNFRVEGSSMDPTYATGQYVLVNKLLYQRISLKPLGKILPFIDFDGTERYLFRGPRRGEVIVFHPPLPDLPNTGERDFIKRVIGLPGDHVVVRDGKVIVNNQELLEGYLHNVQTFCGGQFCDMTLASNQYFVMGDNRTNSSDSRLWGPVSGDKIIGKSWLVYLPFNDFGLAPNQAPGMVAAAPGAAPNAAPAPIGPTPPPTPRP